MKKTTKFYRVTYHEIDTTETLTEIMDEASIFWLNLDWAFIIDSIEPIK
jgi:hypothetical protein